MKRSLRLVSLEAKEVPSANPIPEGISLNIYGTLYVNGDAQDQAVTVGINANGAVQATLAHYEAVPDGQGGFMKVLFTDDVQTFPLAQVKRVYFIGDEGNDQFTNDTALPSTALGGEGDDDLIGGAGNDYLIGGDGDDGLEGRQGNDTTKGGAGDDVYIYQTPSAGNGGLGADMVIEAANSDVDRLDFSELAGGITVALNTTTAQVVKSGALSLTFTDSLGLEQVWGTNSNDKITGNSRDNQVLAFNGNDTVSTGYGNDTITGGAGNDLLDGGAGNDTINGENGHDTINGGVGNDTITGGIGNDDITGSNGNDQIDAGSGHDTVSGGLNDDVIDGGNGFDVLNGNGGNDTVHGGSDDDELLGGSGNDILHGDDGDDSLHGDAGQDQLNGDAGNDVLDGGTGKDTMDGGVRDEDSLFADQGNETLIEGEHAEISVPGGNKQNNNWSCGPNSAWRLLQSYGVNVSYNQLMVDAQKENIITQFGLGTPGPSLLKVLQKYKADAQMKVETDFQDILDRLGEGRPVLALLGWDTIPVPAPYGFDLSPSKLHYVCLTGYDLASGVLFFTDTNGEAKQITFVDFQGMWNWTATGLAYESFFKGLGVYKRTILW